MTTSTTAAQRMRRSRARRKQGIAVVTFQIGSDAIDKLVELGWLDEAVRGDNDWIADSVIRFAERSLALRVTPKPHRLA